MLTPPQKTLELIAYNHNPVAFCTRIDTLVLNLWLAVISNFLVMFCGVIKTKGFPGGLVGKESCCNAEDPGSFPGWRRTPGERKWQSAPESESVSWSGLLDSFATP